jgi:AcrR family transcriptional regulator
MAQQKHVRKQQESSEAVVSEILKAAASEFASHGFEGASTRVIAERAGVFQAQIVALDNRLVVRATEK